MSLRSIFDFRSLSILTRCALELLRKPKFFLVALFSQNHTHANFKETKTHRDITDPNCVTKKKYFKIFMFQKAIKA
jgi:hypothetical protein